MEQQGIRSVLVAERRAPAQPEPTSRVLRALEAARHRLLDLQKADGHWCAELEGDTILESEYVLLLHYLGLLGVTPGPPVPELRHAFGLRGLGGDGPAQEPQRHGPHGGVEPAGLAPTASG